MFLSSWGFPKNDNFRAQNSWFRNQFELCLCDRGGGFLKSDPFWGHLLGTFEVTFARKVTQKVTPFGVTFWYFGVTFDPKSHFFAPEVAFCDFDLPERPKLTSIIKGWRPWRAPVRKRRILRNLAENRLLEQNVPKSHFFRFSGPKSDLSRQGSPMCL